MGRAGLVNIGVIDSNTMIEYLLIAGSDRRTPIYKTLDDVGISRDNYINASAARHNVMLETLQDYATTCLETAYRMIERDRALRQEWFGS